MNKIGSGAFAEVEAEINEKGDEVAVKRILERIKKMNIILIDSKKK
ncbi:hypothetical protein [Bacillus safensis]|nr:hypothetical protein [Bacillus safensis]